MNIFSKSKSIPLWALIPIAIGIHGLILAIPIALDNPVEEKAKSDPVKLQKLPSSKVSAMPKPKISSSPSPSSAIVPPTPIQNNSSVPTTVPQPIASTAAPSQPASQAPTTPATTPPTTTPTTPATAPPITPDDFQIQGGVACEGVKDCFSSPESNGRSIVQSLEQKLQAQGFTLNPIDLEEETGMRVYLLTKNGQPNEYLHIIWTDRGTRSLRLPQPEKNWQRLALRSKL